MIRSMTGFARREQSGSWGTLTWELRTVNHRYLEVSCRLPEELRAAEGDFRQAIAAVVRRGKVDCTLNFRAAAQDAGEIQINRALAERLLARARELGRSRRRSRSTRQSDRSVALARRCAGSGTRRYALLLACCNRRQLSR